MKSKRYIGDNQVPLPFGYEVAIGNVVGVERINKFGYNADIGASMEPIWDYSGTYERLADDTFATMYISSDVAGDTDISFSVKGIDDEYNLFEVSVSTDGTDGRTFVPIDTGTTNGQAWRIFRVKNTSGTPATGNVYISKDNTDVGGDGIPDDVADIQAYVEAGMNQTLMAMWTVPAGKTAYLTRMYASTSAAKVTEIRLFYRPFGGVESIKHRFTINASAWETKWEFPDDYAEKGDFTVQASAAGGGGEVAAGFGIWWK